LPKSARRRDLRVRLYRLGRRFEYFSSLVGSLTHRRTYGRVRCFCLFIGYPRSGHSIVGSLLNAHRHALIAHELNVLNYVRRGYSAFQIFDLIRRREAWFAGLGRSWSGYDYAVPNQWQGRWDEIRVIGDKRGGGTTGTLRTNPHLLAQLEAKLAAELRLVHVVRNPYDVVSTAYRRKSARRNITVERSLAAFTRQCSTNARVMAEVGNDRVLTLRHEDLIRAPEAEVRRLCAFFGLDAPEDYVRDCASIVFSQPRQTRHLLEWQPEHRTHLEELIAQHSFLEGYSFEA